MKDEESSPKPKAEPKTEAEWREDLDRELAIWRESLERENLMLEKMIAALETLEKKISQQKKDSNQKNNSPKKK